MSDGESERTGVSGAGRAAASPRPLSLPRDGQVSKPQLIRVGNISAMRCNVEIQQAHRHHAHT